MEKKERSNLTRNLVLSAMFIALALVLRNFSYTIFMAGIPAMRINISGIFTKLPAILFGPVFGGAAGGILDVLGFMMKPEGGYIVWFTLTAILNGVLVAVLWKVFKNINVKRLQYGFVTLFIILGVIGVINHITVYSYPTSQWAAIIGKIGKDKHFVTIGLEIIAAVGVLIYCIDNIIEKKNSNIVISQYFLKLLIVVGIAGLLQTTLNTFILRVFFPALGKKAFLVVLIPRIVQEIIMSIVQSYIIAFLLSIYDKAIKNNS